MTSKRYKVVGTEPVLDGYQPGEVFEADLSEDQETFLKEIGAIRAVGGKAPKNPERGVAKAAEELAEEQEAAKRTPSNPDAEEPAA